MVKNIALAAIVGLFAASAVVAAPEADKKDAAQVPAATEGAGKEATKEGDKAKEKQEDAKPEAATSK